MRRIQFNAALLLSLALGTTLSTARATQAVPGYITGTVVGIQGQPLPDIEVVADNTLGYNSNLITHTDPQGHYKISVNGMPTTFKVRAKAVLKYKDRKIPIALVPQGQDEVPGNVGGVVDFVLKPDESKPYGNLGLVAVMRGVGSMGVIDYNKVVLTLTPVGKLADGSTGKPLVVKPKQLYGWFVVNVMYGTYKVTATENGQPLEVRQKGDGTILREWGKSFVGDFLTDGWDSSPTLNVEVRHPETAEVPSSAEPRASGPSQSVPSAGLPTSNGAAGTNPNGLTISGTLSADMDLKGAVVFACVPAGSGGKECDRGYTRAVTIQSSGRSVLYMVDGLSAGLRVPDGGLARPERRRRGRRWRPAGPFQSGWGVGDAASQENRHQPASSRLTPLSMVPAPQTKVSARHANSSASFRLAPTFASTVCLQNGARNRGEGGLTFRLPSALRFPCLWNPPPCSHRPG